MIERRAMTYGRKRGRGTGGHRKAQALIALPLGALACLVTTLPSNAAPKDAQVSAIRVSEADGNTSIVISATHRPTFTTWKLERPARVVVDISGARLGEIDVPFDANTYAVGAVSAAATSDDSGLRLRVVLTLRQPADYRVQAKGSEIVVLVNPHRKPTPVFAETDPAEQKLLAEARAKATESQRAAQSARALAEAESRRLVEERAKIETARKTTEARAQRLSETSRRLTEEAAKNAEERAKAVEERRAADESTNKLASEKAASEKARLASEKARLASDRARFDAEQAHRAAQAERERALAMLRQAEAARADIDRQKQMLARAETALRLAQKETDDARKRAVAVEKQAEAARLREEERGNAFRDAASQVEARQRQLEAKWAIQEEQSKRLEAAQRLVAEREAKVAAASAELIARERAAFAAEAKREALNKKGASEAARAHAMEEAAEAQRQRREAVAAAERQQKELALAEAARKLETDKKRRIEAERADEEQKLKAAIAARTAEEARRLTAEQERRKEEDRLAEAQAARGRLEIERATLLAELKRLKDVATAAKPAEKPAPAPTSAPVVAKAPVPPKPVLPTPTAAPLAMSEVKARPMLVQAAAHPATVRTLKMPDEGGDADVSATSVPARPRSITLRVPSRVQRVDFVDEPTRSAVIIDLDEPSAFAIEKGAGQRLTLRLMHADLPRGLERSLDATEYLGPVRIISTYRDPEARGSVRVDVELAEDVPNRVRPDDNGTRLYWEFQKSAAGRVVNMRAMGLGRQGPSVRAQSLDARIYVFSPRKVAGFRSRAGVSAATAVISQAGGGQALVPQVGVPRGGGAQKKRYTGRRIDLDFKGADIHNILRLLSDVGQVNIVTSDDVKGEVTIKMRDVPWDQALDVVLRAKMLGSVREGNLIRVAPLAVLEKELEQEIARQKQITDVLPTETRLMGVSYADAKQLSDRAKDLLSPRGKISVDERTNNLIVSDVARNLALIEELVRNLDTQTSQVVIEARIVEARSTFVRQLGVQWGGTGFMDVEHGNPTGIVFPYNVGIGGGATDGQTPLEGLVPSPRSGFGAANPNFAVNLPAPVGVGSGGALGLTLGSVAGAFNLNLRLTAMESSGQVRILSSPRITTMDNIEASIEQGVAIPISVVSAQGVQTIFVDAKLNLTVKPHVTNEGTVMLNLRVTRNEPDFVNTGARGDPTILKKEAQTAMLVRDGDTAVIGGIYQRNSGLSYAKVPFLADVPVLGVLFRNRRENDDRTEFLVFITPRIANRARALGQ